MNISNISKQIYVLYLLKCKIWLKNTPYNYSLIFNKCMKIPQIDDF